MRLMVRRAAEAETQGGAYVVDDGEEAERGEHGGKLRREVERLRRPLGAQQHSGVDGRHFEEREGWEVWHVLRW